jgi:hypothetical protein
MNAALVHPYLTLLRACGRRAEDTKQPGRCSSAQLLSKDEARRIAANIAKLPELVRKG